MTEPSPTELTGSDLADDRSSGARVPAPLGAAAEGPAMTVAVVGCGAMGSVYAAGLHDGGHEVIAVDPWADHVAAINAGGLRVSNPQGERVVRIGAFTEVPERPVDLVVLAVKAAQAQAAAARLGPVLGPSTIVLTIQNGLGAADGVIEEVGDDRVLVGVASGFGAGMVGPGHAHHNAMRTMYFGRIGDLPEPEVERVVAAWRAGGFDARSVDDVSAMQWEKLICNVAYSAPCALTGLTVGEVRDDPHVGAVSRAAATEAWETARRLGVAIDVDDPVEFARDFAAGMPNAKPSLLLDHEARRISEVDFINGAVPREAAKADGEAPVNATLTALIKARESQW